MKSQMHMPRWLTIAILLTTAGLGVLSLYMISQGPWLEEDGHYLIDRLFGWEGMMVFQSLLILSLFVIRISPVLGILYAMVLLPGIMVGGLLSLEFLDGWDTISLLPLSSSLEGIAAIYFLFRAHSKASSMQPSEG